MPPTQPRLRERDLLDFLLVPNFSYSLDEQRVSGLGEREWVY